MNILVFKNTSTMPSFKITLNGEITEYNLQTKQLECEDAVVDTWLLSLFHHILEHKVLHHYSRNRHRHLHRHLHNYLHYYPCFHCNFRSKTFDRIKKIFARICDNNDDGDDDE